MIGCLADNDGVLPWFPMERHQISDRLELMVNLSNRNAVLAYRELTVKGTGLHLSVNWFLNTQEGYGSWERGYDRIGLRQYDTGALLYGPSGECVWFDKNADGSFAPAERLHTKLTRTPEGGYVVTFDSSGERWLFTGSGWLVSQSDRNGNALTMGYAPEGHVSSVTDSQTRVTTFAHDADGLPRSITDPAGETYGDYAYDGGSIREFTDRAGERTKVSYIRDAADWKLPGAITDPRGNTYSLEYDSARRLTALTKPGGATSTYADNRVTDANGHAATHEFDDKGRQTKATDALGHVQSQTWTAASDVNTTTNSLSHSTTREYDSLNNMIGTKLPTGAENVVGYTDSAHPHLPTQVTDGSGNQVTREYDANGNLTKARSTGLNADIETYSYFARGLVKTRTDGKGAVTNYSYDTRGNLTAVAPPAPAGASSYTYDSLSRLTGVTDGNGVKLEYGYDRLDRVVSVKRGVEVLQANSYDVNGNLTGTQVPGVSRVLAYDARNQLARVTRGSEVVSYTYDKVGNLRTLTTPSGTATYAYDAADRLTSLADAHGGTTGFGYDDADRRTSTDFPGGATQRTGYDDSGRQTSITVVNGDRELLAASYRFTRPDGGDTDRVQSKTVKGVTTDYGYDALGRLTSAGAGTYRLDNASNLLSGEGRSYEVNAADQYTKINDMAVSFDGAGNYKSTSSPATSFTHSPSNQVRTGDYEGARVMEFAYDTADQTQPNQITETPTGGSRVTHVFTRTALGVSEFVDNGVRSGFTRDTNGLLVGVKDGSGARHGAVTDYQGSVLALVDGNGLIAAEYSYAPYGAVTATGAAAKANPFRYLGAYQLQRGHYLLGYRVYDSAFARFRSTDPTGQE
ncbi:RHS repeat-associated core domain-containing protein, partial [Actinosynnema pretiosum]|nr:RHS repeat-associated core domain-containing protein [Actinosynnema pretiosum]